MERFRDRREAGRVLGERLVGLQLDHPVVLGLPRGGVPVADEVAKALGAPLDVLVVRKLGVPGHDEVAMGAVGEEDAIVLNRDVIEMAAVAESDVQRAEERERTEVRQRVTRFREGRPPVDLTGRTAVVVDDGLATGATARAACRVARARGANPIVLAVPVAAPDSLASLSGSRNVGGASVRNDEAGEADEVVCVSAPPGFRAVGMHYLDFAQTDDAEVVAILRAAHSK